MSGGDFESTGSGQERGGKKYKKPKAGSVRIDMTPMVDVIMLLLTFFMLTTTLSAPQLMSINLPKGDVNKDRVKLAANNIFFIRISDKDNIYVSRGREDGSETSLEKVNINQISQRIEREYATNADLTLLLRFDRASKYKTMVDVFDEINRAQIKDRRYAIQPMEQKDKDALTAVGG